jgi:hypothetical protein
LEIRRYGNLKFLLLRLGLKFKERAILDFSRQVYASVDCRLEEVRFPPGDEITMIPETYVDEINM